MRIQSATYLALGLWFRFFAYEIAISHLRAAGRSRPALAEALNFFVRDEEKIYHRAHREHREHCLSAYANPQVKR
jgi:hypothetical protein